MYSSGKVLITMTSIVLAILVVSLATACSSGTPLPPTEVPRLFSEGEAIAVAQRWLGDNTYGKYTLVGQTPLVAITPSKGSPFQKTSGGYNIWEDRATPCSRRYEGHIFSATWDGEGKWTVTATGATTVANWEVFESSQLVRTLNEKC